MGSRLSLANFNSRSQYTVDLAQSSLHVHSQQRAEDGLGALLEMDVTQIGEVTMSDLGQRDCTVHALADGNIEPLEARDVLEGSQRLDVGRQEWGTNSIERMR